MTKRVTNGFPLQLTLCLCTTRHSVLNFLIKSGENLKKKIGKKKIINGSRRNNVFKKTGTIKKTSFLRTNLSKTKHTLILLLWKIGMDRKIMVGKKK